MRKQLSIALCVIGLSAGSVSAKAVRIVIDADAAPRVAYGVDRLVGALKETSHDATVVRSSSVSPDDTVCIAVGRLEQTHVQSLIDSGRVRLKPGGLGDEGFLLASCGGGTLAVIATDDSGALYGCLELARRIRESGRLPSDLHVSDRPAFKLRGTCIAMQKTYILPGRHEYEYPYTPELFPFFYDKAFWTEYLDSLVEKRMNMLCLWNGHPFASLVKLPEYPYALEVGEAQFERNVEMYRYIAAEADKRGIWLVQKFYNILLSQPFAARHGLDSQLSAPTPLAADYTRKSIAEFVRQYPNVGLYVCLGEAMLDVDKQVAWCTQVILPGVKDGMRAAGLTDEPPLIIRAHATDPHAVMPAALQVYGNLFTEAKYNGESLTTWEPRGPGQEIHLALSRLDSTHIANIHILANLEPFRYGAQRFIQKSVQAARDRLGARGLHVYPLAYWNWPNTPDTSDPPLKQYERDWIWFDAWARYAWDPDVSPDVDREYWLGRLTERYGTRRAAACILDAYNESGECAPRLIRRFGITEGNRQTLSLGMTLDQLVNPDSYGALPDLWLSQSPPGERLQEYAEKEWNRQPHHGETPPQIVREVLEYSGKAVASIDAAETEVTKNRTEFDGCATIFTAFARCPNITRPRSMPRSAFCATGTAKTSPTWNRRRAFWPRASNTTASSPDSQTTPTTSPTRCKPVTAASRCAAPWTENQPTSTGLSCSESMRPSWSSFGRKSRFSNRPGQHRSRPATPRGGELVAVRLAWRLACRHESQRASRGLCPSVRARGLRSDARPRRRGRSNGGR